MPRAANRRPADDDGRPGDNRPLPPVGPVPGRRAGYRAGRHLSPELQGAIEAEAARLAAIDDPVEVIDAVTDVFAALDDALDAVAVPRLRAVSQLTAGGRSYDAIARATSLSKSRVAQLARAARRWGL